MSGARERPAPTPKSRASFIARPHDLFPVTELGLRGALRSAPQRQLTKEKADSAKQTDTRQRHPANGY
jgi:hypothetical protein